MPNARNDGQRLRLGTFTSSGITSAYTIRDFANVADQLQDNQPIVPWAGPYQCEPPEYARIWIAADGTQRQDGFLHGVLGPFSLWTFGMTNFMLATYWPGGVYSSLVSMMLFDATDTAIFLNATAYRPVIGQDFEPVYSGWQNVKIRYDIGAITA